VILRGGLKQGGKQAASLCGSQNSGILAGRGGSLVMWSESCKVRI